MLSWDRQTKIYTDNPFPSAPKAWEALSEFGELVYCTAATNRAEFLQECRDGKYDGVVAIYRTFMSARITGLFDEELVKALPSSLKYLAHCGMSFIRDEVLYHC